jgi:hypothetical protein
VAITAQEHTDLKLGDLSAQLHYLREQNDSMQKIGLTAALAVLRAVSI